MVIDLTVEQFDLIQKEVDKLEGELFNIDENDPWGSVFLQDEITRLKEVLRVNKIDLSQLQ